MLFSKEENPACETQPVHTIDNIAIDLDNGREIDAFFLDFIANLLTKSLIKDSSSNCLSTYMVCLINY